MNTKELVYSRNVVEFATVAKEFCAFLEACEKHRAPSFVAACSKILPLLYYKTTLLPSTAPIYEEGNEQFVTEYDYKTVEAKVKHILGQHNDFLEIHDQRAEQTYGEYTASIAEYLADIYQDLKNFTMRYQLGNTEVMNDALWECTENFKDFWGIRTVNLIRAFHILQYGTVDLSHIVRPDDENKTPDTSDWFITRRQHDNE